MYLIRLFAKQKYISEIVFGLLNHEIFYENTLRTMFNHHGSKNRSGATAIAQMRYRGYT